MRYILSLLKPYDGFVRGKRRHFKKLFPSNLTFICIYSMMAHEERPIMSDLIRDAKGAEHFQKLSKNFWKLS